ncbi:hypothetical protein [Spirulina sp. 06S082]|uniref:hypothetical protein n=1 Tax=Spirulina sp. 06S082 TaxID=3110248 RepID=UPI002B22030C|nr:hypothetical protein [Spirulina sp. 06S082]MEA5468286.1 hypothetical protein [Spirulina sp. 06S082]
MLKAYRGATPVEIARAVERYAIDFYCRLVEEELIRENVEVRIETEALHGQLNEFVMASKRDAEELQAIGNRAYYCRAASSPDRSRFALSEQELFEYSPHQFESDRICNHSQTYKEAKIEQHLGDTIAIDTGGGDYAGRDISK